VILVLVAAQGINVPWLYATLGGISGCCS